MSVISRLEIDQQYAAIGVRTTPAQLSISTPRPQMRLVQERPELIVETEAPEFELNWRKVYSESGLKSPDEFSKNLRDRARGRILDYTLEAARDGDYLAKLEQPGNRVARMARKKELAVAQTEVNIAPVPQSFPEVNWSPGFININWTEHRFQIEWTGEYLPEVVVDPPYSIEIFLRNKPYIRISVVEGDSYQFGRYVDEKL